jgi:hypothetical protein
MPGWLVFVFISGAGHAYHKSTFCPALMRGQSKAKARGEVVRSMRAISVGGRGDRSARVHEVHSLTDSTAQRGRHTRSERLRQIRTLRLGGGAGRALGWNRVGPGGSLDAPANPNLARRTPPGPSLCKPLFDHSAIRNSAGNQLPADSFGAASLRQQLPFLGPFS